MTINRVPAIPQKIHSPLENEKKDFTPLQKAGICAVTVATAATLFYLGTHVGATIERGNFTRPTAPSQTCPPPVTCPKSQESIKDCEKPPSLKDCELFHLNRSKEITYTQEAAIMRELNMAKYCASQVKPDACVTSIGWNKELFNWCTTKTAHAVPSACKHIRALGKLIADNKDANQDVLHGFDAFWAKTKLPK